MSVTAPSPLLTIARSWSTADPAHRGTSVVATRDRLFGGAPLATAPQLKDALRDAYGLIAAEPTGEPMFGVIQAASGYDVVRMMTRGAGDTEPQPFSDSPQPLEIPGTRQVELANVDAGLAALATRSGWQPPSQPRPFSWASITGA
ncbi:MAG: hypothetical protein JWO69_37 [Thermoleophilia bacterium]|jgi:hypothetical protein|nr:hypothetical protein [Thermoleophilia bacterium]